MTTNQADQSPFVAIVGRAAVQRHTQTEKEIDDKKRGGGQSKSRTDKKKDPLFDIPTNQSVPRHRS